MNHADLPQDDLDDEVEESLPLVPPNRLNRMVGLYVPPESYYRNDGNKHIKSVGDPT